MNLKALGMNVAATASFVVALAISYAIFTSREFGYAGYHLYARSAISVGLTFVLCVAPLLFYRGARAVSSVVSVFVYGLLYVPTLVTLAIGTSLSDREALVIQLFFAAAMSVLFAVDVAVVRLPFRVRLPTSMPKIALLTTMAFTMYVLVVYRGNLAFVSFADVYLHRSSNQAIGSDVVTRYLTSWMTNVFAPICLAFAFITRSRLYFVVGVLGFFVMYLATAAKWALLIPAAYPAVYWALSGRRRGVFLPLVMGGLTVLCLVLATQQAGTPLFVAASLLLVRTIINGGIVTARYYEFFDVHPQTGLTHVNMIGDVFGHYPYGELAVGQVVGRYFWGPEMNANAHFWATDGLAAFGLWGLPIATAICAGVFVAMNSATRGWNHVFVALCFLPFVATLLNTSVFQSVWSGGALFLMLFFVLTERPSALSRAGEPD